MGEIARRAIAKLEQGGSAARDSLFEVSEVLRKAFIRGIRPMLPELEHEQISDGEANDLRIALANYYETEKSPWHRRRAIVISAMERVGRSDLRAQLVSELHLVMQAHRMLSIELSELLLALDDIYALQDVALPGTPVEHQRNAEIATDFLRREGISLPY